MIRCSANLFRIAYACASSEETRYYPNGVFVEPHAQGGVTLTTTDGHRMLIVRDETGHADESAIIRLSPAALKECKSPKRGPDRALVVDGADAHVREIEQTDESGQPVLGDAVAVSPKCRIDGTFLDYRRVVPQSFAAVGAPAFNGAYLGDFGKVAGDLAAHFGITTNSASVVANGIRVLPTHDKDPEGCPALIQFTATDKAFGILMSVRHKAGATVPEWFRPLPTVESPASQLDAAE